MESIPHEEIECEKFLHKCKFLLFWLAFPTFWPLASFLDTTTRNYMIQIFQLFLQISFWYSNPTFNKQASKSHCYLTLDNVFFCQLFEIWQTLHHLGAKNVGLFTCVHFASLDLFQLIIVAKELRIFLEPFLVGLSWSGWLARWQT